MVEETTASTTARGVRGTTDTILLPTAAARGVRVTTDTILLPTAAAEAKMDEVNIATAANPGNLNRRPAGGGEEHPVAETAAGSRAMGPLRH